MNESAILEPPLSTPTATTSGLADLILVRLLPEPKSLSVHRLREAIAPFFRKPPTPEQITTALTELRADGFVTSKGQVATPAGRARALQFLDLTALPPKSNWRSVKARYLVPRALGLEAGSQQATAITESAEKLAAFLLKRKLGLPVGTAGSIRATLEAIVCRELGYPNHATLKELIPVLLAKAVEYDTPLDVKAAERVVPQVLLGAKRSGFDALREIALAGWLGVPESQHAFKSGTAEEPFDLEAFANTVRAVARKSASGWFGDNRVFINHVWNQLREELRFTPLGFDGFQAKLIEANRAGLLALSRADLVQLMDPADVRASETTYLNAVYHFILVERN